MKNKNFINTKELWKYVINNIDISPTSIHGTEHWEKVERNGLYLAQYTGAFEIVIRLFSVFHDCKRRNDGEDKNHGLRGALFAKKLRGVYFSIDDDLFELLYHACYGHTDQILSNNPTIATCWDADRLDLTRIGIKPDEKYLNTEAAKKIVRERKMIR